MIGRARVDLLELVDGFTKSPLMTYNCPGPVPLKSGGAPTRVVKANPFAPQRIRAVGVPTTLSMVIEAMAVNFDWSKDSIV
jgi:hypothetical protein